MANEPNKIATQAIPFATTITPDPYAGKYVLVGTLTGNVTIANPASPEAPGGIIPAGTELFIDLTQDGTGSRTVTFGAAFKAAAFTASTAAGRRDILHFVYDGTAWVLLASTVNTH